MRVAVTPADLGRSVIAVPPLARRADLALDRENNRRLLRHIEAGGVTTVMYGGNANLFHAPRDEFPALLDFAEAEAASDTWVIPAIGPDYDRVVAMARALRGRRFPTAMLLPASPAAPDGVARLAETAAEIAGRPVILYVREPGYVAPPALARLIERGVVFSVKFGRSDRAGLAELVAAAGAARVVSGMGEAPGIDHVAAFGLPGFTSGAAAVAPARSQAIHAALKAGDVARARAIGATFEPFEAVRDRTGGIAALHDAVTALGIADMGPHLPPLAAIAPAERERIAACGRALMAA